jgi:ribosomal protein S18 acetylase RimI-like enzyme
MTVEIVEEDASCLAEYARLSTAFEVRTLFDAQAIAALARGEESVEEPIHSPYIKDYDAYPDSRPLEWAKRFRVERWGLIAAFLAGERVGGAAIAIGDDSVEMLNGRPDSAVLWDVRVAPHARSRGIGSALLERAESWARGRGARMIRVETQNVNVPACRLYSRRGFTVEGVCANAYEDLPEEVQLIWKKSLDC